MNIGSLIFGAIGMYIYLRRTGVEPPPEILKWERTLRETFTETPRPSLLQEKEIKRET